MANAAARAVSIAGEEMDYMYGINHHAEVDDPAGVAAAFFREIERTPFGGIDFPGGKACGVEAGGPWRGQLFVNVMLGDDEDAYALAEAMQRALRAAGERRAVPLVFDRLGDDPDVPPWALVVSAKSLYDMDMHELARTAAREIERREGRDAGASPAMA